MSERDVRRDEGRTAPDLQPNGVAALEARLGRSLGDRRLALAALTHKSYVNEHRDETGLADNERLEFLGDAVIDLAVSHRLMERFPGAREGDLSKMRAAVVDEQGLSEMARALDLGGLLRLGRGEELTGGRAKASLLADAMEAVVAAVYLDGGLEPVLALVDRFLDAAFARAAAGTLDRDFKTQLQELAQSRLRATPRYRVVAEHGPDHSKTFEVETDLRGEVLGRGAGRSKKDAEQAAAKLALDLLGRRFTPGNGGAAAAGGNGAGAPRADAAAPQAEAAPIEPPQDAPEPAPGPAAAVEPPPAAPVPEPALAKRPRQKAKPARAPSAKAPPKRAAKPARKGTGRKR
jgi:ribonuclease III